MAKNVRYQIFVSSTYTDLIPVRRQVTEQILSMNHIPAGMEMFSASGRQQWTTIQKAIDNSDYYVLIIGERYGSISPEDGISYTEKEFNYALSRNIPTLCFLPGKNFSTPREHREADAALIEKLDLFKTRLKEQLCDFWEDGNELVSKVSSALYKIFTEEPGIGWIRGDAADPDALTKLVHAMEENNRLKTRIQQMEELSHRDLPELSMQINGHDFSTGPLKYALPTLTKHVRSQPNLTREDIPSHLNGFVSDEAIESFNDSNPTSVQINEHNEVMRFYQATVTGQLAFSIKNDGPVKANNVLIRIYFSEGIRVINERQLENVPKPALEIPSNPIQEAEAKYQAQLKELHVDPFARLRGLEITPLPSRIYNHLPLLGPDPHISVEKDGSISGDKASVRQASTETLRSDIYLMPLRRGHFSLSVELLCDEFRDWQRNTFDLIIE